MNHAVEDPQQLMPKSRYRDITGEVPKHDDVEGDEVVLPEVPPHAGSGHNAETEPTVPIADGEALGGEAVPSQMPPYTSEVCDARRKAFDNAPNEEMRMHRRAERDFEKQKEPEETERRRLDEQSRTLFEVEGAARARMRKVEAKTDKTKPKFKKENVGGIEVAEDEKSSGSGFADTERQETPTLREQETEFLKDEERQDERRRSEKRLEESECPLCL